MNSEKKENSKLNELNDLIQNNKNIKETKEEEKDKDKDESFEVKPELNDVEEENLKEIAGLMKNLLEEWNNKLKYFKFLIHNKLYFIL